ncbi:VOC family protein [Streptomyces sp. NPDC005774]|uniref:VOC family protein n=1 Tax=Streptomyces TaxID=1883 RepID=UPI0033F0625E
MTKHLITHLRYAALATPDLQQQLDFYTNVWGLKEVDNDSGLHFLAAEGSPENYVIRLRQGDKRMDLVSFGAANPADVDELAGRLIAKGVKLIHEPRALDTPGGGYGIRFFDGDGRTVEVSADVATRKHRKIEEREGIPVKLSHFVVNSPSPEATVKWYIDHLDFRLSDSLSLPHMGEMMWFLRCNPQHHSFAVGRAPHVAWHHASFELRDVDTFMFGTGRVLRAGGEKVWGTGRHHAGDNTYTYFMDRGGNCVEYTTELEIIQDEDLWHPSVYDLSVPENIDLWGTSDPFTELVSKKQFNDPDKSLFMAPPV